MAIKAKEYMGILDHSTGYTGYNYHHTDGAAFRCTGLSLGKCRRARDLWIEKSYLVGDRQVVFKKCSRESYFVLNPNLKGYVMLVQLKSFGIYPVARSAFFRHFRLSTPKRLPRLLSADEGYRLMLEAYRLQFGRKND